MAKIVLITGPQAVGKMTVGQELSKITDLKLFHNHMTIDLVSHFFSYGTEVGQRIVSDMRKMIFEEVAKSNLEGIIFTCVVAYNCKEDIEQTKYIKELFKKNNGEFYYVELQAPLEVRLERNKTENRLNNKPFKKDFDMSERLLLNSEKIHRTNSLEGEIKEKNYIKLDNSNISAKEVAKIIKERFKL